MLNKVISTKTKIYGNKLLLSYLTSWRYPSGKYARQGLIRVWRNGRTMIYAHDPKTGMKLQLPVAVLDLIVKEIKKDRKVYLDTIHKKRLIYDFKNGIHISKDFYSKFKNTPFGNPTAAYLKMKMEKNLPLTPSEEKEIKFRIKHHIAGF